ncbi:hypothetical protein E4665_04055 [Sporolactobacillus shoreae]|uniref:YetF C-terminal domain-containing protein n=1 Tax=Sporolactobacillus shoreae TaxID=1465501 RepID=A0A4Z0GSA6_9BACL|nr:YetF domain-containing protein [Sporolactobacillus shoreae]TGA99508.1 hypothetical protein E4665_04055 [Sporolactobacillus shoreae]
MGTSAARMLLFIILLKFGLRDILGAKPAERTLADFTVLFFAADLSLLAVIRPNQPLAYFLVPFGILILTYRLQKIVQQSSEKWLTQDPSVPPSMVREHELSMSGAAYASGTDHKYCPPMALPLIENGKVRGDNLRKIGKTQLWLRRELRNFGYRDLRQVNYLTMDDTGNFFMDLKNYSPEN